MRRQERRLPLQHDDVVVDGIHHRHSDDLREAPRCRYVPWAGDAVILAGYCSPDFEAPGLAFRAVDDGTETLYRYLYGADLFQLGGWNDCSGASSPVCEG